MSVRPYVRLTAFVSAAVTGLISTEFVIRDFTKICRGNPYVVKIGQKYRFIVTADSKCVNWYQFVSISEEVS